nr:MAG TPA: hypothetical protein [Caudoviricetes sp.]
MLFCTLILYSISLFVNPNSDEALDTYFVKSTQIQN